MKDLTDFSSATVFNDISLDAVENLCSHGQEATFPKDHVLFVRGQDARELMFLIEGTVELYCSLNLEGNTRDVVLESRESGDLMAWSALIHPNLLTLSARCKTPCTIIA